MAKKPKTLTVADLPLTVQSMLERAIHTLKLVHAKSGVDFVIHSEKYGITEGTIDLTKAIKHKRTRQSKLPYGTLTTYFMPLIKDLQPDDLVQIPVGDFEASALQGAISATTTKLWGKGSSSCVMSADKTMLEVWRLPVGVEKRDLLAPNFNNKRQTEGAFLMPPDD
jgi:hypothetical protein